MSDFAGELIDGRYQLISQVATGGMASIYSAVDTRLDRKVAVKIMHPHLAQDEDFVNRFIREAKAAAALSHPNIVAVQDQGWNTNGVPAVFIVMELVEGHTLRDFLDERGKFNYQEGLQYFIPVVSALAAAHKAGIVHRDIKPENILISKEGRVKVADFGLAHGALIGSTMTAESSVVLGSVSYLSPEQVQRGVSDSRSDVYSAGIVAYELFVGEKPFSGDTPIQIAYMHVNNRIPRISESRKDVPKALDDLIYRATSSSADDRPRDAGEFHAELQNIQRSLDPKRNQMSLELDIPIAQVAKKPAREKKRKKTEESVEITQTKPEMTARTRRRASKRVRRNRKIALFLAVALGVGGWYVLVGPGAKVVVPSVVGGTVEEANAALTPLGLTSTIAERRFDEEIPVGKILGSDPAGGDKIDQGGIVKLIISKGQERYVLPVLTGLTPEAAIKMITAMPLKAGTVTEVFNSTVPKGFVISATPGVGEKLKRDTVVNLQVSKGVEQVALPNYIGKIGEQALNELVQAGFDATSTFAYSETVPMGAVISQTPSGVNIAPKGSSVALVVSQGSAYAYIPNLYSVAEAKAVAALKALDLKVVVKRMGTKSVKNVTNMVPKVGTKVKRGSTVTITVG